MKYSPLTALSAKLLFIFGLMLGLAVSSPAQAARKALVIGNAEYFTVGADGKPFADPKTALPRSIADARGVAAALREVGFAPQSITTGFNLNAKAFSAIVNDFAKNLAPDDEVVFYFSGHGISTDSGGNFLVPTDGPALDVTDTDQMLQKDFQSLNDTLAAFKKMKPKLVIAILDACRSYPTRQLVTKTNAARTDGLNTYQSAEGQMIMFAASHGRAALPFLTKTADTSPYSVYTRVLIEELKKPAEHVVTMAQRVSNRVGALTAAEGAGRTQLPEFQSKIKGEFTFVNAPSAPPAAAIDAAKDQEIAQLRAQVAQLVQRPGAAPPAPKPVPSQVIDGYDIYDDPVLGKASLARDPKTGLIWQRCSVGQSWNGSACTGEAKQFTYDQARQLAQNGWRVPTVRELHSIVVCSSGQTKDSDDPKDGGAVIQNNCTGNYTRPTLHTRVFPQTPERSFWTSSPSSSPDVASSSFAWYVYFGDGYVGSYSRSLNGYVRLVRASQ